MSLFVCPTCSLMMNRYRVVDTTRRGQAKSFEWRCWDCDHTFGGGIEQGMLDLGPITPLDLGVVRAESFAHNDFTMFYENWIGVQPVLGVDDPPPPYKIELDVTPDDCAMCSEPVLPGEPTSPFPVHTADGLKPMHVECALRSVMGGWGHHEDHALWCGKMNDPDGGLSYRESARRVYEHFDRTS